MVTVLKNYNSEFLASLPIFKNQRIFSPVLNIRLSYFSTLNQSKSAYPESFRERGR